MDDVLVGAAGSLAAALMYLTLGHIGKHIPQLYS
jgi:hypothetical protein